MASFTAALKQWVIDTYQTKMGADDNYVTNKAGTTTTDLARTACVSIIDDDGDAAVMSRLFPLLESKGVVGACAIITSKPDSGASWLTWAQIDTLVGAGWELLGHGHSYTANLSEFPVDADLDYQIGEGCQAVLEQHAHTTGFVYPQGVSDVRIRRFTRRHYAYAFGGTGYFNPYPLDTMNVARIGFGSWTASNPTVNGNSEKSTLAYYQECVDYAKTNGLWLVLMTHVGQQDAAADTMLGQLLDYIAAESVPVVTPRDGYAMHGHRFWAGDMGEEWTAINEIGVTGKSTWSNWRLGWQAVAVDTALSSYRRGETIMPCSAAHPSLPVAKAGMLTTHRPVTDTGGWAYARQEYVTGDARTFVRSATSDSAWGTWYELQRVTDSPVKLGGFNTYTAAQPITDYPTKSITVATNSGAAGTGFPGNAAGMTTTYRITGNGWDRQEFRKYNTAELWTRYVDASTGAWTSWVQIV